MSDVLTQQILAGPAISRDHDGPFVVWAEQTHRLTRTERALLALRLTTIEKVGRNRFPHIDQARSSLQMLEEVLGHFSRARLNLGLSEEKAS